MNIASANRELQVLARHKILQGEGWRGGESRDVIDADNNGSETYVQGGFGNHITGRLTYTTQDPALVTPYQAIAQFAKNNHVTLVTQDDLGELKAKNVKLIETRFGDLTRLNSNKEVDVDVRSLTQVAQELNPFPERPARWAIDTSTQEFVIYSPKNGQGPLAAF